MPVVIPAFSTLGAVLAFILAVALTVMWVQILRGPLVRLAGTHFLGVHPFGFLTSVVSNVDGWLSAAEKGTERAVVWSFHTTMAAFSTTAKLTEDLALATWQGLHGQARHFTKHTGAAEAQSVSPRVKALEREYKGIDQRLDRVERREQAQRAAGAAAGTIDHATLQRGIDRLAKREAAIEREIHGIEHVQSHAGAKAIPGSTAIPRTVPRVVPRSKGAAHHWTDVMTKVAAAGLVATALTRLGLKWVRCPNVGRLGRFLCGTPSALMDLLLAGLTLVIATEGIVPFAEQVQSITDDAVKVVGKFWHADAIGKGGDRALGSATLTQD